MYGENGNTGRQTKSFDISLKIEQTVGFFSPNIALTKQRGLAEFIVDKLKVFISACAATLRVMNPHTLIASYP
jgi:hypothetical protein